MTPENDDIILNVINDPSNNFTTSINNELAHATRHESILKRLFVLQQLAEVMNKQHNKPQKHVINSAWAFLQPQSSHTCNDILASDRTAVEQEWSH